MDIHGKPIDERIDWLFGLADRHSAIFRSPEAWLAREHYLAEHPTAIAVLKCMDGRINIPVATNTPVSYTHLDVYKRQRLSRLSLDSSASTG